MLVRLYGVYFEKMQIHTYIYIYYTICMYTYIHRRRGISIKQCLSLAPFPGQS